MLRMRPDQFAHLEACQEARFLDRVASFLRAEYPQARKIPPGDLFLFVLGQVEQARLHGFRNEDHLVTFTLTGWLLGPDFEDRFPAAGHMLRSTSYSLDMKARWLSAWTVALFRALEVG